MAAQLRHACTEELGFFSIVGHGISPTIVSAACTASRNFFDGPLSREDSLAESHEPYGFMPFASEALAQSLSEEQTSPPDLKQTYSMGPVFEAPQHDWPGEAHFQPDPAHEASLFAFQPNKWPAQHPAFVSALVPYFVSMDDLAARLLCCVAHSLELRGNYFTKSISRPMSALRVNSYPALQHAALPGQKRAGAHTDYGCLTILHQEEGEAGLEAVGLDGEWGGVPAHEGGLTVNIGDMLQVWTNGLYKSTMHRVSLPHAAPCPARLSLAFFQQANPDARIECVPTCLPADGKPPLHEPMSAGEHIMRKFNATQDVT